MNDVDPIASVELEVIQNDGPNFFRIGLTLTIIYLILVLAGAIYARGGMSAMTPNEWGDFLAGIFGPLALLWVVLGFLQQGTELRYSRNALLLQAKELKESVEAQKNMGEAAWAGVNLERDLRVLSEQERIRSLQPVFTLHPYNHSTNGQFVQITFSLANSGKDGIDLVIEIVDPDIVVQPSRFGKFTAAERTQIHVQSHQAENLKDCTMLIRYKDVEGRAFVRAFSLVHSSGTLEVVDALGQDATPP